MGCGTKYVVSPSCGWGTVLHVHLPACGWGVVLHVLVLSVYFPSCGWGVSANFFFLVTFFIFLIQAIKRPNKQINDDPNKIVLT